MFSMASKIVRCAAILGSALWYVLLPSAPQAQGIKAPRVQPALEAEAQRLKPGERVRIIIRLKDQVGPKARAEALSIRPERALSRAELKQHRPALVKVLRDHALRSQVRVRALLEGQARQGLVRNIRSHWLANVITAEVDPAVLKRILELDEVESIKQDVKRPTLLQATSWGVTQINADDVWALTTPYTGTGVLVGVLDTGVDLTHQDLVHRLWINSPEDSNGDGQFTAADNDGVDQDGNGYVDDVVGWDFANNDNTPGDWHGHGTHVAGTVAGDGTGGTHTGVAPGARIMTLAYSASPTSGQAEAWDGMEYALANGADIVSFSSGWRDAWAPDYATWRENADVLTDAGVLFVVSAGNDNPHEAPPGDVLTPARVPRALAVGATDNTDAIATFSGTGPTSWQGVSGYQDYIYPPGLLKPDVSAPGVSVLSLQNGGGYVNGANWSGTSMAAPHVSGLAALLLQKDPALLPHELAYLIRETAVDLGTAGPDNVYGYGRVDALAAVNRTYPKTPTYDLSVTGTNQVWTTADIWVDNNDDGVPDNPVANQENHLYARIRNLGGQAVGNAEVKFFYADVGTIGIGGFDPNGDGDPSDGNFNYIDSYFMPVLGPVGSSQAEGIAVVHWNVPAPTTDHWCVGIGIVAPNPPNAPEVARSNNRAFRNFFDIEIGLSEMRAFRFLIYPDPREPLQPFRLELIRRGLPPGFEVQLGVEEPLAERWFRDVEGFEPVKHVALKGLPEDDPGILQAAGPRERAVRLLGGKGALNRVSAADGKPVLVRLVIKAPKVRPRTPLKEALLVINARGKTDAFGGLTLSVKLRKGAPRLKR